MTTKQSKPRQPKTKRTRKARVLLIPGQYQQGPSVVVVPLPVERGGTLRKESLIYNVWTKRQPNGDFEIGVQYVDVDGSTGRTFIAPPGVAARIFEQRDRIIDDCNRDRAKRAQETKKLNKSAAPESARDADG